MSPSDFAKIDSYFQQRGKGDLVPLAYSSFVANVSDALKQTPNQSSAELRKTCDHYLTDAQLST